MINCPRCKGNNLEYMKYFFITFCKDCDFEFKGTIEELEVIYE